MDTRHCNGRGPRGIACLPIHAQYLGNVFTRAAIEGVRKHLKYQVIPRQHADYVHNRIA